MRRPYLWPYVKGTEQLANPVLIFFFRELRLQSLQMEPQYQSPKMMSECYFHNWSVAFGF